MADDGQIDQAADDVVAEYSRLPAVRSFIARLAGFVFYIRYVTVFLFLLLGGVVVVLFLRLRAVRG